MTCTVTYFEVQPSSTSQAIELLKDYRKTSGTEAGNASVDLLREIHRDQRFVVLEDWKDEPAFRAHENADHTAQFRIRLRDIQNSPYDQRVLHRFAVGLRRPAADAGALFVVTHVDVPPPRGDATEVLLKRVAEQSLKDEGNLQYDVLQQNAPRMNHFTVVAVWNDEKSFASHQTKPHTRRFRDALGPMLGAPYDERLYKYVD